MKTTTRYTGVTIRCPCCDHGMHGTMAGTIRCLHAECAQYKVLFDYPAIELEPVRILEELAEMETMIGGVKAGGMADEI